jgi:hybrid cluster-associated redox disulfide protein
MKDKMIEPVNLSPDISVAELLHQWPAAIPVFLRHRMGCVGCSMAAFEILSDALHIYNLPEPEFLLEIIEEIQSKHSM